MARRRRGTISELASGRFKVRVDLGANSQGKRERVIKHVQGTRKDAEALLTTLLAQHDQGSLGKPQRETVAEYLARWQETVKPEMKPATQDLTAENLARYIVPGLGKLRLDRLTPLDVQSFYSSLAARGLSPSTVRRVHGIIHSAFRQAVGWGLIPRNPASREFIRTPKVPHPEIQFLTPEQAKRFIEASSSDRHAALWAFLLNTGCRPGEALALRWKDLDLKAGIATINRRLTHRADGSFEFTPGTKTGKGRAVPLSPGLIVSLKEHRARQAEERLGVGGHWKAHDLVFCTELGSPLDRHNLAARHLKPILKSASLPSVSLYGLRHTCATMLVAAGINPKVGAERLGHASVKTFLDKYAHVLPAMQADATSAIERFLYRQS